MWRSARVVAAIALAASVCWGFDSGPNELPGAGPELRVLEVRALTEKEAVEKSQGFVGPNVLLRLRLENKSDQDVYVLFLEGSLDPLVCMGRQDLTSQKCWTKMLGLPHEWLSLPPFAALEWEEMDASAFAGQTHVLRVLIKKTPDAEQEELASGPYTVPPALEKPTTDRQHL